MKILLLLLFFTNTLMAQQIFPSRDLLDFYANGKGGLITSDGTNKGNFPACPDGQFLMWDSTQTLGVKCSGDSLYTGTVGSSFLNDAVTGNTYIGNNNALNTTGDIVFRTAGEQTIWFDQSGNVRSSGSFHAGFNGGLQSQGVLFYNNGDTTITSAIYSYQPNSTLYLTNSQDGPIYLSTNGSTRITVQNDGGISFNATGGGFGGNVPYNCHIKTDSLSAVTQNDIACDTGEIVTGGGCAITSNIYLNQSYPVSITTWRCNTSASSVITAYAVCCDY